MKKFKFKMPKFRFPRIRNKKERMEARDAEGNVLPDLEKRKARKTDAEKGTRKFKLPGKKFWFSKKIVVTTCILAAIVVGGILAANSVQNNTLYNTALANVAEARYYMKSASSDTLGVQFFSGMREEPYTQDGKAAGSTAFAIINVDPKDNSLKDYNQIEGTVKIGEEQIPIVLAKNPYDRNFATDISRLVEPDKTIEVTLFITSTNHPTFTLENPMNEDAITWKDALKTATEAKSDEIKKAASFEVYVKIVNDVAKGSGAFWYIQFVTNEGTTHFCVIAPDGTVIG